MSKQVRMAMELNGAQQTLVVESRTTLLQALRENAHLTGTPSGCEEGQCGVCTVLVDGQPVRSCMMFALQAHGSTVETVESLAGADLHPLQKALRDAGAGGCGFCAPGILMVLEGAVRRGMAIDHATVSELLSAVPCRCGGEAILAAALGETQNSERDAA